MPGRWAGARRGDPLPADGGGGPGGAPHLPPARRGRSPTRASSRCASTTTAPVTPPGSRTTRTGSRPGWPAWRRPASYLLDLGAPDVSAVGMRLGATLAALPGRRVRAVPLAGPVGPVPERPHVPARGRGAVRPRRGRRPGARRRSPAHPRLPVRRRDGVRDEDRRPRQAPGRPPARRPGAAAVPRPTGRLPRASRRGSGSSRARSRSGPRRRRTSCSTARPATATSRRRRSPPSWTGWWPAATRSGSRSRRPRSERPRWRSGGPRVARWSASARCGSAPLGLYGVVDEPVAPTPPAPWVVLVNVAAEHHIGPGPALGRVGPALGGRRLPGHPDRPDRRRRQPRPPGAGRGRDVRPGVDRRHARGRADPVRRRRSGGRGRPLLRLLLGVRGRDVGEGRRGLRGQPAGHALSRPRRAPTSTPRSAARASCPAAPGRGAGPAAPDPRRRDLADLPPGRGLARARSGSCAAWSSAGTAVDVIACRDDGQHFTEVLFWRPFLARLRRNPRFRFEQRRALRPLAAEPGRPAGRPSSAPRSSWRRTPPCPPRPRRRRRDQPARPRPGDVPPARAARRRAHLPGDQLLRRLPDRAGRRRRAASRRRCWPGTAAVDFEVDQWTFFKPAPEDLLAALRARPARDAALPVPGRADRRPGWPRARSVMPEVDSFYLPDVVATDYRHHHVKSSLVVEAIDLDAKVFRYFHNAGYFELSGEDFDGLFGLERRALPPYVELVRFDAGPALSGPALRERRPRAARRLPRPGARPTTRSQRFLAALEADLPRLLDGRPRPTTTRTRSTTRGWRAPRSSCWPATSRWLLGEEGEKAAAALDDVVGGTKMLLFRLARRRAFDVAGVIGPMADGWETADRPSSTVWSPRPRATRPGVRAGHPRAGSGRGPVGHEWVAHVRGRRPGRRDPRDRRDRHGLGRAGQRRGRRVRPLDVRAPVGGRRPARCAAGDNEVRVVVHPLTELLDELPRKPRARWRTMVVDEPRLRWVRTQVLGRAPGFAPGPAGGRAVPADRAGHRGRSGTAKPARGDLVAAHPRHPEPRRARARSRTGRRTRWTSGSTASRSSSAAWCGRPATSPPSTGRWRWASTWSGSAASRRTRATTSTGAATSSG